MFAELVCELDARHFQVLIHAIGDRGVHVALDAIARARQVNGPRDARHQLVHVELVASRGLQRFRQLGVVACMQPRHLAADGAYANFCQQHRGSLAPAKAADLIALSDNLFELPPEQIKDCRVDLTMVAGQIHHQLW